MDWWQEQNIKPDGGEVIDIGAPSHTSPIRERTPRTRPNILLGELLEDQTMATGNEVEMLELPSYSVNEAVRKLRYVELLD